MVAEYLEHGEEFERLANEAADGSFRLN